MIVKHLLFKTVRKLQLTIYTYIFLKGPISDTKLNFFNLVSCFFEFVGWIKLMFRKSVKHRSYNYANFAHVCKMRMLTQIHIHVLVNVFIHVYTIFYLDLIKYKLFIEAWHRILFPNKFKVKKYKKTSRATSNVGYTIYLFILCCNNVLYTGV